VIPLIIPCHRVLRNDGNLGGFSAPGGTAVKKKMLELEVKESLLS
jgi:methylated-DNA-[protein]-cysteine S-methyltransferase